VFGTQLIEGVRGQAAKVLRGRVTGTELAISDLDQYADDLATRGYQLHERLRSGVVWETYRASTLPRQPRDVTSSGHLATEDGVRKLPLQCTLFTTYPQGRTMASAWSGLGEGVGQSLGAEPPAGSKDRAPDGKLKAFGLFSYKKGQNKKKTPYFWSMGGGHPVRPYLDLPVHRSSRALSPQFWRPLPTQSVVNF